MSFASGSDCLDDLNSLREEALYKELCLGGISLRAMGDFLRSFSSISMENLSDELVDHSDVTDFMKFWIECK